MIDIDDQPHLDLTGSIAQLDLYKLKLTKSPLFVTSDFNIDVRDLDPDRFTGNIVLKDLGFGVAADSMIRIDSLAIESHYDLDSNKFFDVSSEVFMAHVDGQFRVLSLPNYFINYFTAFNPKMAKKLGLKEKENLPFAHFNYTFDIINSSGLLALVAPTIDTIRDLHLEGWLHEDNGFFMKGNAPQLTIGNASMQNVNLYANADGSYTNIVASHDGLQVGKLSLSPLTVFADLERDTLYYTLNEVDYESFLDQINIEGKMYVYDNQWQTQLYNSALQIFGQDWSISDQNFIRFNNKKILVRNLDLRHNDEYIKIKSVNDENGLLIELQDLPLAQVNRIIKYEKLNFDGLISGAIKTSNIKTLDGLNADISVPDFSINEDDYGEFSLSANSEGPGAPVFLDLQIIKGKQKLLGDARVILPNRAQGIKGSIKSNVDVQKFPSKFIEYIVTNGLSNTTGIFDGKLSGNGPLNDPLLAGYLDIPASSFKVDILGVTYYIQNQRVNINSDIIDLTDVEISDKFGNTAQISGGLTHHNLAKLGFNASLRSNEILILETTKADNQIYYGTVYGDVAAYFSGTVAKPIIRVNASNRPNSRFIINTDNDEQSGGLDFIVFDTDTSTLDIDLGSAVTGVDLTIDMSVNRDLDFQIILDESTRDIMRGTGRGDMIFKYSPAGEISLFGDYTIEQGEYLFTYSVGGLVPVNKPFRIRSGSKLTWSDDPLDANIDVRADYVVVASPYNLIAGQVGAVLEEEARRKTDVALELILQGSMLQPDINFDINFPEVTGQLRSTVEIELERLKSDQTEMQNQAASLIIFRDFVNNDLNAASSINVVANTLSEWLSNQVSYYLSGIVGELTDNWDFIDDIQFDVGYRLPSGEFSTAAGVIQSRSEVGIGTRIIMFDRRLEASIKGDYVNSNSTSSNVPSSYFNTNFELDYLLTKDRRWRLRAYFIQDQIQTGRRARTGFGLAWRREYDNLEDFRAAVKELKRKNQLAKASKK